MLQPIEAAGGAGEQRRLFGRRAAAGDALERVPEHVIAAAALIDREVALEHRALRAERLDACLDIRAPYPRQLFRTRKRLAVVHREADHAQAEAAELHVHVWTLRQLADAGAPFREDL